MDFSVVIPTYQSASYIAATLSSIRTATMSRDFEVLLVDDASPDFEALSRVLEAFPEARLIRKPGKTNAADSRNIGMQAALADFIFLLDSDDHFLPGAVDRRMKLQRRLGAGVVFGNFLTRFPDAEVHSRLPEYRDQGFRDYILGGGGDFRTSTVSLHRPSFGGTTFDERTSKHQDWVFAIRCSDRGESIGFDADPIARLHVDRSGRMSTRLNVQASRYFIENYLTETAHINSFSHRQWTTAIHNQDMDAISFLAAIFNPRDLREWMQLKSFQMAAAPGLIAIAGSMVQGLRRGKHLVNTYFTSRQEADSSNSHLFTMWYKHCGSMFQEAGQLYKRLLLCESALQIEDELALDYLIGYQIDDEPLLQKNSKYPNLLLRIAILFVRTIKNYKTSTQIPSISDIFLYAHTTNQFDSLASTTRALNDRFAFYVNPAITPKLYGTNFPIYKSYYNTSDVALMLILFFHRMPLLYLKLHNKKRIHSIKNHFDELCMPYILLPHFARILSLTKACFIVQSNDHTVANRSLRIICEVMNKRNIYLQHASVSNRFPGLQFDISFLDGMASVDIYLNNLPPLRSKPFHPHFGKQVIILSGQKKKICDNRHPKRPKYFGIAVNMLDEITKVLSFIDMMRSFGYPILVRTHPLQDKEFQRLLDNYIACNRGVFHQSPSEQTLVEFFSSIYFLIAGNTSIHLESLLSNTPSYFYDFCTTPDYTDYYKYKKNGILDDFPINEIMNGKISLHHLFNKPPNIRAIQYYSSTYNTDWEGHEGELVALCLKELVKHYRIPFFLTPCQEYPGYIIYEPAFQSVHYIQPKEA